MTVAELIDYLVQFEPDTLVLLSGHDVDLDQPYIALDNPELELSGSTTVAHPAEALAIAQEIRDLYTEFENTNNVDYHDYVTRMTRLAIDLSAEVT